VLPSLRALSTLEMGNNSVGAAGAVALAAALPSTTTLVLLGLSFNSIGDAGVAALAAVLPSTAISKLLSALLTTASRLVTSWWTRW
jgi:hypothetical protein